MTWNIHGGVGFDRRRDLDRIVKLALRQDADIIALQEVDSRRRTPDSVEAFGYLTGMLGGHSSVSRLITAADGDYGHAIVSRWPMTDTIYHDVTFRRREPRAAIETVAQTPLGPLHVVAAHLGLGFGERRHQAELLAEIARHGPYRTVMLGDFNDWVWRGAVHNKLDAMFPGHSHLKTFPSLWPMFSLDRIYCRPRGMLLASWTDSSAKTASDHLPVIGELAVAEAPA